MKKILPLIALIIILSGCSTSIDKVKDCTETAIKYQNEFSEKSGALYDEISTISNETNVLNATEKINEIKTKISTLKSDYATKFKDLGDKCNINIDSYIEAIEQNNK